MDTLIISSGVVSSGLTADSTRDIMVLGGGTVTDSIATDSGMIYTDSDYENPETNVHGGTLQSITANGGEVWVFNYGSALDITAVNGGYFYVAEGSLSKGLAHSGGNGLVYADATADQVTVADGGKFYNLGGKVKNTVVSSGGSFVVQFATAETSGTNVLAGGVMRIVAASSGAAFAGKATGTIVNGGFLEVESGTAEKTVISAGSMRVNKSNTVDSVTLIGGYLEVNEATANATVISGGSMRVSSGGIAQGTIVSGGIFEIGSASGSGTVVNGGIMRVSYAGSIQNTTVNAGQFEVVSGAAASTTILTGAATLTGATVSDLNLGSAVTAAMDSASILSGKAAFEAGASITITGGTIAFDTALTTAETAQITGFSAVANSADAAYTLTVAEAEDIKGDYLLATDAAGFNGEVAFGEYTLAIGKKAVLVDGLYYSISLNAANGLVLSITEEPPALPTLVYVNSDWIDLAPGDTVTIGDVTAKIGYDAFATGDEAVAFIGGDTSVSRNLTFLSDGSLASHLGFDSITLDADSFVTLDTTYTGKTITIDATGYADFTKKVMAADGGYAPEVTISVVGEGFGYQILKDGVTLLVTSDLVDDTYANTEWTEESVKGMYIGDVALVWDKNAFNSFSKAAAALGEDGTLYIEGGTSSEAVALTRENDVVIRGNTAGTVAGSFAGYGGTLTVENDFSATAISGFSLLTVNAGSLTVSESISLTKNGILNFDLTNTVAGNTKALVNNLSLVTNDPKYTLTDPAAAVGTYLLASDAAVFDSGIEFGMYTLKVGEPVVVDDAFTYTLAITDNNDLTLTVAVYVPPKPDLAYVNSAWSDKKEGDTVTVSGKTATIGFDAFATLTPAIAGVSDNGAVEVVGGTVSFADGYSKTITVDADATVIGKGAFVTPVTVNGTIAFDTVFVTAESPQFTGFSKVAGTAKYTLTDAAAKEGVYLLASDAATFSSDVTFGTYTLKLGESVLVGESLTYTLGITDNNDLALTVAAYVPPPPTTPTLAYVNSAWSDKKAGDIVTVGEKTATIGYDAFATLAPAIAGVTDDGTVEVVGGTVSFADGYSKTVTVDAGATVVGKATFDKAITVNGTFAFDTASATAEAAQFGGFSKVAGTAKYTLTDAAAKEGVYLLASDAATFSSDVTFGTYTLKLGESVLVGETLTYTLGITGNNDLTLTVAAYVPPATPAKSDIDANGVSDVMFQWTGGQGQIGFWMNGTSTWKSTNTLHPVDTWEVLGAYDMNANGKADSVLVGNVVVSGIKGAFIGYYVDSEDLDANWINISYLTNNEGYVWKNKVGNLTGNEGMNSIVWHTTDLGALGVWTDGTDNWVSLGAGFDANWEMIGCGDFTGSGKDTVLMSYAGGQVFYTIGIDGAASELTKSDLGWVVRAIGDFSGDGKDDIVAFHAETGLVAMWGDGTTANWSLLGQLDAGDWFVVGAGDYNGDKQDDLLVRQYSTGMLGYYTSGDMAQWNVLGYGVDMSWTVIA